MAVGAAVLARQSVIAQRENAFHRGGGHQFVGEKREESCGISCPVPMARFYFYRNTVEAGRPAPFLCFAIGRVLDKVTPVHETSRWRRTVTQRNGENQLQLGMIGKVVTADLQ